jgi:hypothetical protein
VKTKFKLSGKEKEKYKQENKDEILEGGKRSRFFYKFH